MKFQIALSILSLASRTYTASAFVAPRNIKNAAATSPYMNPKSSLFMSTPVPDPDRMKQIMEEEARNPATMKASAEMLKNLSPADLDNMLREMDNMPMAQRKQMEAMGMNPNMMRQSMEMMKANPAMAKQMANMMETMTPDELMEKSRQAQEQFANMTGGAAGTGVAKEVVEAEIVKDEKEIEEDEEDDEDEDEDSEPVPPPSKEILDTLYKTAELMSYPPDGKVTLAGFSTIPPIALLIGDDKGEDLSKKELRECWADASLGATRVDRAGFERVWIEVQEYFWQPILEKSRERAVEKSKKKKRGGGKPKSASSPPSSFTTTGPQVGQNISSDLLEQQVKNMSDSDMDMMLEQMKNMTPAQEAQMKTMGVDPEMMKKTAKVMNSNPLMKSAAKMMMKNMTADQMKQASQQAQERMSSMSPEEIQKAMDELDKRVK